MKLLMIAAMVIFSSLTFAQENDGYHQFNKVECDATESCLVHRGYDLVIKMAPVENRRGEIVGARLSSSSFLADTVYKGANVCFTGKAEEVCSMLDLMSNGDGGHGHINTFKCDAQEAKIDLDYDVEYDGYGSEKLTFEIKACE